MLAQNSKSSKRNDEGIVLTNVTVLNGECGFWKSVPPWSFYTFYLCVGLFLSAYAKYSILSSLEI